MPFLYAYNSLPVAVFLTFAFISSLNFLVITAYAINPNALASESATHMQLHQQYQQPTSALASKVIYQSSSMPNIANIYKEMIVSSKPLNLRKYANGLKSKKAKKDSKIYYIPIPASPYRYIPGVGYDYQPMKINPILMEKPAGDVAAHASNSFSNSNNAYSVGINQQQQQQHHFSKYPFSTTKPEVIVVSGAMGNENKKLDTASESKLHRMHRGDYYFNGKPFRLQVAHAHAQSKNQLTPQNLKSKLYFNKKFIY